MGHTASPAASATVPDPVDQGGVLAEEPGGAGSEGDRAGPGEGGQVDDGVGPGLRRQAQAVGQDQAALGVGVEDLDGGAAADREHVADPDGVGSDHVLDQGQVAGDLHLGAQGAQCAHGADDGGGAAHVAVHALHALARLQRVAAGVEGDPLAHQGDVAAGPALGGVGDLDEAGLVGRPLADAQHASEALATQRGGPVDPDLQPGLAAHLPDAVGQRHRDQRPARLVDQVPGQDDGPGHLGPAGHRVAAPPGRRPR